MNCFVEIVVFVAIDFVMAPNSFVAVNGQLMIVHFGRNLFGFDKASKVV